jgi:hypothetical protein
MIKVCEEVTHSLPLSTTAAIPANSFVAAQPRIRELLRDETIRVQTFSGKALPSLSWYPHRNLFPSLSQNERDGIVGVKPSMSGRVDGDCGGPGMCPEPKRNTTKKVQRIRFRDEVLIFVFGGRLHSTRTLPTMVGGPSGTTVRVERFSVRHHRTIGTVRTRVLPGRRRCPPDSHQYWFFSMTPRERTVEMDPCTHRTLMPRAAAVALVPVRTIGGDLLEITCSTMWNGIQRRITVLPPRRLI